MPESSCPPSRVTFWAVCRLRICWGDSSSPLTSARWFIPIDLLAGRRVVPLLIGGLALVFIATDLARFFTKAWIRVFSRNVKRSASLP